ncbi:MAG: PEP-CTERM sorting domain-containing protein [Planctomycetales bacterium]|nr:PEP-CTERM sorting domain-containing protein [Planctomycetales bacterium]
MKAVTALLTIFFVCLCNTPAAWSATTVVFDFESIEVLDNPGSTLFDTPLVLNSGGIEMAISHESNLQFAVNSRNNATWVNRYDFNALSAFNGATGTSQLDPGAFILDFNRPIDSISVDMGDFGQESDTLVLQAFSGSSGTGTLLGEDTGFIPTINGFVFENLSVAQSGIRSVRMIGGSEFIPNSVFYDNITVTTAIPEPSSTVLLVLGLLGGACCVRLRR